MYQALNHCGFVARASASASQHQMPAAGISTKVRRWSKPEKSWDSVIPPSEAMNTS